MKNVDGRALLKRLQNGEFQVNTDNDVKVWCTEYEPGISGRVCMPEFPDDAGSDTDSSLFQSLNLVNTVLT